MKITIKTEDGKITRPVLNENGLYCSEATWPAALATFLEMLQGVGYIYGCPIEDMVAAAHEAHEKGLEK